MSGIQDLKPNHPWAGFRKVAKVLERPKRLYWVLLLTGMIEHPEPFLPPPTFLSSGNRPKVVHRQRKRTIIEEVGGE